MIGYAFMGKAHSDGYIKTPVFFHEISAKPVMTAICGRNEGKVKEAAAQYGWKSHETDWRKLVARPDIDVIDVSTPNNSHAEISIAAAKAGKHVFCEKPLAMSLAEAKEMRDACNQAKVKHMVAFNYRRVPAVAFAKQLIGQGKIGTIYHMRAVYLQDWILDPNFPLVWRLDAKVAGSGALGDLGAHILDLAYYLVGPIKAVSATTATFIKQRKELADVTGGLGAAAGKGAADVTVDDAFVAITQFENGALGTFEATRFANGRKNYNCFEINGSKGSIVFNLERMNELQFLSSEDDDSIQGFRDIIITNGAKHPYVGHWWPGGHIIGWEHSHIHQIADLCDAIGKNQMPSPSFDDGVKNQAVLDAVERSAKSRRWEEVAKA
ncbi:MAG: Gfo/Idh/MocA family oxidoreductase [Planctomycetes bacterium]|nr:Gfo/Idh/MocA family oxidoreductase [Planctomycetota bacterium]